MCVFIKKTITLIDANQCNAFVSKKVDFSSYKHKKDEKDEKIKGEY